MDLQQTEAGAGLAPQAGFDIWTFPDGGTATDTLSSSGLDVTLTAGGGGIIVGRGANNGRTNVLPNLTQPDLMADFAAGRNGDGTVTMDIAGLSVGDIVTVTLWHNDSYTNNAGFSSAGQTITPSLTSGGSLGGATAGAATGLWGNVTHVDTDLAPTSISFTSDGTTADILLTATGSAFVPMNGFTIDVVPEPTSLALLGLGAACFLRRRR